MHARLMEAVRGPSYRATPSPYFFAPQFVMPFAALLLIVVTASTAFAAKGSLPGDPLYVVKTKMTEPLQGALAFSTEDKFNFHTQIAQVRLEEAEMLASQNRLDEAKTKELETSIDVALAQRQELASKLEVEEPRKSSSIARLDTSITAHSDILIALGAESSSSTTRANSDSLAMKVRSNNSYGARPTLAMAKMAPALAPEAQNAAPTATMLSLSVEEDSAAQDATSASRVASGAQDSQDQNNSKGKNKENSKARASALALGKKATSTLESLKAKAATLKDKLSGDTKDKLNARFERIQSFIDEGNNALARGDFDDAKDSFNEALDRETTLSAFITAGVQFDRGILGNLLGNDSRWGNDR